VSHDTSHVRDFLSGEDWLIVNIGACILENIVGPVSRDSGLVDWGRFIVNAAASECQETRRYKCLGFVKVYMALNKTGTKDVVVDHVAKLSRQTKKAALVLLVNL
jgi:hypothetical protein